ncbi:hypothetical protein [Antarctobacter heliothermus]|jgi:hypothetical protein|uniref:Uncharacterized protein n=1 Tax=Antarctobacter heliothermus TaxID=74033 RepID=A0A239DDI4_9RHOB|nr:hypothetical protein [Antarctobacter heliothermus]SNS30409.1 hypothetical protein SAMN04488078_101071 [Antarctobacter heliothermus]
MNLFRHRPHSTQCNQVRKDWIDERLREARIVVADVVNHSDHLLRLACNVLVQHGETPTEREDARILLVVIDAKSPGRAGRHRPDPEVHQ